MSNAKLTAHSTEYRVPGIHATCHFARLLFIFYVFFFDTATSISRVAAGQSLDFSGKFLEMLMLDTRTVVGFGFGFGFGVTFCINCPITNDQCQTTSPKAQRVSTSQQKQSVDIYIYFCIRFRFQFRFRDSCRVGVEFSYVLFSSPGGTICRYFF